MGTAFEGAYPHLSRWVTGYGWLEIGQAPYYYNDGLAPALGSQRSPTQTHRPKSGANTAAYRHMPMASVVVVLLPILDPRAGRGGMIWESASHYASLDAALREAEEAVAQWMREQLGER